MDDNKKSINTKSKSKSKSIKINKSSQKLKNKGLKRPQTPYFLFCSKTREDLKKIGNDKKLTSKELGEMWKQLSEDKKKALS